MPSRTRDIALASIAFLASAAGWIGVLAARWDRVERAAFAILIVALIAAGFRSWFASSGKARDWWFGFAAFGLFYLLSPPGGERRPILSVAVDRLGDATFGTRNEYGIRLAPTALGKALATVMYFQGESPMRGYPEYLIGATRTFASLIFALVGGLVASYLGRNASGAAADFDARRRVPRLGLAAMILVATMAGATFVLDSRPEMFQNGWFTEAPGCLAGHFALVQTEALIVLFAALEARFGGRSTRPWWTGFALFGGAYLLLIDTPTFDILPSRWLTPWHQDALHRFVAEERDLVVNIRGMIMFDYATQLFFRLGYSWAPLLGFLPAAWIGSGVARAVDWLSRRREEATGGRKRRSAIARMMVAVVAAGVILTAARGKSEVWTAVVGDSLVALLAFAALWTALGRGPGRSWWFGFALVGGVDFLLWATRSPLPVESGRFMTPWPPHEAVQRLHHLAFERFTGDRVPGLIWSFDEKLIVVLQTYTQSGAAVLMAACLPLAYLGGFIAQYIDRRTSAKAGDPPCISNASPPPR